MTDQNRNADIKNPSPNKEIGQKKTRDANQGNRGKQMNPNQSEGSKKK
jgi:hypothetical protein